ncbi:MAG: ROK family protein [Vicinamibacterales bacterium]
MRIGVDVGGTKLEVMAIDRQGGEVLRRRIATPRGSYEGTLDAIRRLVIEAEAEVGPSSVGIGMPGAIAPATGLVKNANSTWLNGQPFGRDLSRVLAREVRLANDANCLALSEATDGAAAGCSPVFAVILGTGVGGGLAVHGQIVVGVNAVAGEWGHNPVPWPTTREWPGPPCYCGRTGCIETMLSGPGLERDHEQQLGITLSGAEIVAAAASGDPVADATLARYEDRLARSLAAVINVVDPEVIVLGGGLSNISRWYESVPRLWDRFVFSDRIETRLVRAQHGDSSGVRGAAWLWPESKD